MCLRSFHIKTIRLERKTMTVERKSSLPFQIPIFSVISKPFSIQKSYYYLLPQSPTTSFYYCLGNTINNELRHLKIEHKPNRMDWCIYLPKFSSLNHQASTMLRIDQQSGPNEGSPRKPNFSQRLLTTQNACCYNNGAANDLRLSKLALFDVLNKGNGCEDDEDLTVWESYYFSIK